MMKSDVIKVRIDPETKKTLKRVIEEDLKIFNLSDGIRKMIDQYINTKQNKITIERSEYQQLIEMVNVKKEIDQIEAESLTHKSENTKFGKAYQEALYLKNKDENDLMKIWNQIYQPEFIHLILELSDYLNEKPRRNKTTSEIEQDFLKWKENR